MVLTSLLAGQAGVITRGQALGAGLTRDAVDRRVRTRRWRPVHPGVYLAAGHDFGDEARIRAAVLWAGPGAVLSGAAAAWWHGMSGRAPATVAVTAPHAPGRRPGVARRRRPAAPEDVGEQRGLAVTAPALTVLEAAPELGAAFLDGALRERVGFAEVRAAHLRNLRAPGATAAARALAAAAGRAAVTADALLVATLRAAGVPGWRRSGPGGPGGPAARPAVLFPAGRVVVEAVGWAWPADPPETVWPGWTVLRVPWQVLNEQPREALARVAAAVADPGGRP
ncbi:hypothetical protein BJF78_16670 [Pseudonocardia sp. CNS-139]|nr:hypothetical protein BJF78_16670 [Pseudonocardia sp. CNS-139]